jgi:hypothetical protein
MLAATTGPCEEVLVELSKVSLLPLFPLHDLFPYQCDRWSLLDPCLKLHHDLLY